MHLIYTRVLYVYKCINMCKYMLNTCGHSSCGWKRRGFLYEQARISFTRGCILPSLVGPGVIEKEM